jgi:hypothetical protein
VHEDVGGEVRVRDQVVEDETNATNLPSPLMPGSVPPAFACAALLPTLTRAVVPVSRS